MSYPAMPCPEKSARAQSIPVGFAYLLVCVVGATVLAVSAYYLYRLALSIGMPGWLAWTLPVALDAGAAGATVCWVAGHSAARVWGRGIALSALAGTVLGNALSHLIGFGLMEVTPLLVILTGAVYPAALWAMVHLALVLRAERYESISESIEQPVPDVSVDRSNTHHEIPSVSAPRKGSSKRHRTSAADRRRKWIATQLDAGHDVTGGDVERQFGSKNGAREVAQVKAQRQSAPIGVGVA